MLNGSKVDMFLIAIVDGHCSHQLGGHRCQQFWLAGGCQCGEVLVEWFHALCHIQFYIKWQQGWWVVMCCSWLLSSFSLEVSLVFVVLVFCRGQAVNESVKWVSTVYDFAWDCCKIDGFSFMLSAWCLDRLLNIMVVLSSINSCWVVYAVFMVIWVPGLVEGERIVLQVISAETLDSMTLFLRMIRVASKCLMVGNGVPMAKVVVMLGDEMIDFPTWGAVIGNSTNSLPRLRS